MKLLILAAVLALTACASAPPKPNLGDPAVVFAKTASSYDSFQKKTTFVAPDVSPVPWQSVMLQAIKGRDADVYGVYMSQVHAFGWYFYHSTFDSNGQQLETQVVRREVVSCKSGCTYDEASIAFVTRDWLEKNKAAGVRLKLVGKSDEMIVTLPPAYVQGFLLATK